MSNSTILDASHRSLRFSVTKNEVSDPLTSSISRRGMAPSSFAVPDEPDDSSGAIQAYLDRIPDLGPLEFLPEEESDPSVVLESPHQHSLGLLDCSPQGMAPFPSSSRKSAPDITKTLGKRESNIDRRRLCDYLLEQNEFQVLNDVLYVYRAPCWQKLEGRKANVFINTQLTDDHLAYCLGTADIQEISKQLMITGEIQRSREFTSPECCINFIDGTLNLMTKTFYPHRSSDEFTSYVNCRYHTVQRASSGDIFEQFVEDISDGDPGIRQQLLELIVIALAGIKLKYFYVLLGPSHTGKSQFGRFLEELLGMDQVESVRDIKDFGGRFTTGEIAGKRMVACLDLPDEPLPKLAVGKIKELVGDDSIKGENKYQRSFTYNEKPLLLFAGNYPITFSSLEQDDAFLNRMVVIPFKNPCSEEHMTRHLYKCFLAEAPYIIREAIDTFDQLRDQNFSVTRTEVPLEYQPQIGTDSSVDILIFIKNRCIMDSTAEIETNTLWIAYTAYTEEEAPANFLTFSKLIGNAFSAAGYPVTPIKRVQGSGKRGFRGIRLVDNHEDISLK